MSFDWEQYRNEDKTINVHKAYIENVFAQGDSDVKTVGSQYIKEIQSMQKICSRQIAAVIFVTACRLDNVFNDDFLPQMSAESPAPSDSVN